MAEESGFQIGKKLYPLPQRFRLGDPVLVEQLTRLTWPQFVERLPDEDDEQGVVEDPIAMLGMLAISISQTNPTWRIDRVVDYVRNLSMDDVQLIGPEAEEDAGPPAEGANGAKTSSTSPPQSKSESEPESDQSSQKRSGTPTSVTSPE